MADSTQTRSRRGCWITGIVVLIVPILLIILVSQFTPILNIWLVRTLISRVTYGEPDNMDEISRNITTVSDLTYGTEPNSDLDIYYPTDAQTPLPVVVYIHGGGFIGGDKSAVQPFAMAIANEGYLVANINYGFAPEQPYPTAVTQVNQALDYVAEQIADYGGDSDRLFIAGNSAGAQLTSQVAALITNESFATQMDLQPTITPEQLKGVVLINGIYNMQTLRETGFPNIGQFMWAYTGAREFETYHRLNEISTIEHVTADYPPVFITAGDIDPLQSQTLAMIDELNDNDIDVTSALFTDQNMGLDHDFILNLDQPTSEATFSQLIAFLNQHANN